MKLQEVVFRESVNEPDSSTPQMRFVAGAMTLDYAEGVVTATGSKGQRVVPLSNVRFMTPLPPVEKKK